MSTPARHRGPQLPYSLLAGVEPCPGGWLVVSARLQGVTVAPQDPEVMPTFLDVIDYKPAFSVITIHVPLGLLEEPERGGRAADREARKLLGWPRAAAVVTPPVRSALAATTREEATARNGPMSIVGWGMLPRIREVAEHIQPYWQRTVFEVNPELGFYQLNGDRSLRFGKRTPAGQAERRELLVGKLEGIERVLDASLPSVRRHHLLDAAADLWTARRIASRAASRLPEVPEWDEQGLRREVVL